MIVVLIFFVGYIQYAVCSSVSSVTFYGSTKNSFVKYPIIISENTGHIIFEFRTLNPYGLLFYADDSDDSRSDLSFGNLIKMKLVNGRLDVLLQVSQGAGNFGGAKRIKETIGHGLNDNNQHYVEIKRNGRQTIIKLDGEMKVLKFAHEILKINSSVFVGGPPERRDYPMSNFRDRTFLREDRFIGCISNLRYNGEENALSDAPVRTVTENGVTKGCLDQCEAEQTLKCMNNGKCLNMYTKTGCDCRGTGFTGETCTKPSQSLRFSGEYHAIWEPTHHINSFETEILIRFKSAKDSGILVYAVGEDADKEYMLLELVQRSLVFKTKLKGSEETVFKIPEQRVNQTLWRFVKVFRKGASISLSLNDGYSEYTNSRRKSKKSFHSAFKIKKVFFGGFNIFDGETKSQSQSKFDGCLQDVVVNNVELIELAIAKNDQIHLTGGVGIGCDLNFDDKNNKVDNGEELDVLEIAKTTVKQGQQKPIEDDSNSFVWIIVGGCVAALIPIAIAVFVVRRSMLRRAEKRRQYRDHYLRQTGMRIEVEDLLPTEQKCIREEIAKRKLQTFSPIRKQFYVSPSNAGSLPRSHHHHHEPIYQSHQVFEHAHPCISQNYAIPSPQQQHMQCQQNCHSSSPTSSHYVVSRKCSHASSIRYQTPNVKTADSIKSFSSQQS